MREQEFYKSMYSKDKDREKLKGAERAEAPNIDRSQAQLPENML